MSENYLNVKSLRRVLHSEEPGDRQKSFSPQAIAEVIAYGAVVASSIHYSPRLDRAMELAKRVIVDDEKAGRSTPSGQVFIAGEMNSAKGRFSRCWHAPHGGLWGCLLLADVMLAETGRLLPLAMGVAGCEAVRSAGASQATIRWVNDLLVGSAKLGGFLAESFFSPVHQEAFHLLGFGINVNNTSFPEELAEPPMSLCQLIGSSVDLGEFALLFLRKLAWNVGLLLYEEKRFLAQLPFSGKKGRHSLLESWLNCSDSIGRRVSYGFDLQDKAQLQATVTRLEEDGAIRLQLDDGSVLVEHSGELRYLDPEHSG